MLWVLWKGPGSRHRMLLIPCFCWNSYIQVFLLETKWQVFFWSLHSPLQTHTAAFMCFSSPSETEDTRTTLLWNCLKNLFRTCKSSCLERPAWIGNLSLGATITLVKWNLWSESGRNSSSVPHTFTAVCSCNKHTWNPVRAVWSLFSHFQSWHRRLWLRQQMTQVR